MSNTQTLSRYFVEFFVHKIHCVFQTHSPHRHYKIGGEIGQKNYFEQKKKRCNEKITTDHNGTNNFSSITQNAFFSFPSTRLCVTVSLVIKNRTISISLFRFSTLSKFFFSIFFFCLLPLSIVWLKSHSHCSCLHANALEWVRAREKHNQLYTVPRRVVSFAPVYNCLMFDDFFE